MVVSHIQSCHMVVSLETQCHTAAVSPVSQCHTVVSHGSQCRVAALHDYWCRLAMSPGQKHTTQSMTERVTCLQHRREDLVDSSVTRSPRSYHTHNKPRNIFHEVTVQLRQNLAMNCTSAVVSDKDQADRKSRSISKFTQGTLRRVCEVLRGDVSMHAA